MDNDKMQAATGLAACGCVGLYALGYVAVVGFLCWVAYKVLQYFSIV
jgi:hypothetical protein